MLTAFCLALLWLSAPVALEGNPSRVNEILVQLKQGKTTSGPERLELMENDVNAWLNLVIENQKEPSVRQAHVDFLGDNRIEGTAEIDMDKVKLDGYSAQLFKNLLKGVQKVDVIGKLECADGKGEFSVEEASLNGISVPAVLVEQVLSYATSREPPNIDITEPFNLPADVRSVKVLKDRIVIER
jgi:hypothetical protein